MSKASNFCIICKSAKNVRYLYKDVTYWEYEGKFNYFICNNCGLVFQEVRNGQDGFRQFYDDSYWEQDIFDLKSKEKLGILNKRKFGNIYDFILKTKKRGGILDVGSGSGGFLAMFDKRKWKISGFDVSKKAADVAKKVYRINVKVASSFDNIKTKSKYDFVTMLNSLEHVVNPESYLERTYSILKNDGFFIIQIPNFNSLGSMFFKKKWYPLQPGRHLFHFNSSNISKFLESNGFSVTKIDHNNKEHAVYGIFQTLRFIFNNEGNLRKNIVKKKGVLKKQSLLKKLFILNSKILSELFYYLGFFMKKGEYISVYAKKEN